jgi:outer membrane lipoprotein-sorting protein
VRLLPHRLHRLAAATEEKEMKAIGVAFALCLILINSTPARADEKVHRIVDQAFARMQTLHSMKTTFVMNVDGPHGRSITVTDIRCMKPNFLRADIWSVQSEAQIARRKLSAPHEIYASDGTTLWHVRGDGRYASKPAKADASNIDFGMIAVPLGFFNPPDLLKIGADNDFTVSGTEVRYGVLCDQMRLDINFNGMQPPSHMRVLFGRDHVLRAFLTDRGNPVHNRTEYLHVKINPRLTKADFVFKKPAFATTRSDDSDLL